MIKVLRKDYWSKSEAFLVPLTGLSKSQKYPPKSYLFWEDYSIENYQLILKFTYENQKDFNSYCRRVIFPALDRGGYLIEIFESGNQCIMVLDLSEWAKDIEMFLIGKYSKLSTDAKDTIHEYHMYYDDTKTPVIAPEIGAALDPEGVRKAYGGLSAIEYVAETYEINLEELRKLGELASLYDRENETLSHFFAKMSEEEEKEETGM